MRNQKDDMKELVWRILVLLFHFEKVHKKTSYLKQAACLVYKNKVLLKIVHRFPSSYKAWLTLSQEDEQLQNSSICNGRD